MPGFVMTSLRFRVAQVSLFVDRNVRMPRVLHNEIQRKRDYLANEHRVVEPQPRLQFVIERLLERCIGPAWIVVLQARPIRFEGLDQFVDRFLAVELRRQIANHRILLMSNERPGNASEHLKHGVPAQQTEAERVKRFRGDLVRSRRSELRQFVN